ncbi:cytochrome b5 [Stereum hirsutum FP-91666 SS1]|uniref:cytochrome b5 n=1 Tax=Stereum hirsutum (strain FP-91666) TaxID=721885 RepID=UPI000440AA2B|nr:cytochrome b5 [Stereum hirsutum FP-91666 SS1]EIM88392.1 cytochrome b5 [Stereum hirsutum FP-91666 SS1]
MSWLTNMEGKPDPNFKDDSPKVADPSIPNRMVSTKNANKPFLSYKNYREQQRQLHDGWVERQKEREAKIARGEKVGPPERDPTEEREISLGDIVKFLVYVLLAITLGGKFITGDFMWGYRGKWTNIHTYLPSNERLFSERTLAQFDGSDPEKPLYLAIDGDVFDVSDNRRVYGPGGSYHIMAGKDAARAFGTGCFQTHQTHDLRGLTESELRGVNHWKSFFKDHKSYHKIGRVQHPPIDPASPIPEHCNPKEAKKDDSAADGKKKTAEFAGPQGGSKSGGGAGSNGGSSSSQEKKKKREEL